MFAARAQLQSYALRGPCPKAPADVIPADDQILIVVGAAPDQHMDMGMVGVPMIDGDPVELCAEIAFGILHQFAGEGAQIAHVLGVLRRDNEPEMMPVVGATLGEILSVGRVRGGVEHMGVAAVAGDAFAPQIGNVVGERGGTKSRALVADDTRLHHHPARV